MQLKELLKTKITSAATLMDFQAPLQHVRNITEQPVPMPWWLDREWLRIEQGIYPAPTDVVTNINTRLPQFALHVSAEDPTQISYTPDKAYGEADRQVRTSLARFLAKYYPHLPDDVARDLQAEHLADLNDDFEEIKGEDIRKAYKTLDKNSGTGACMSSADSMYAGGNPTIAYDAPGISMAVLRNGSGKISARTMLFCPSETDKRFIRFWGDPKLKRKLERKGYKAGSWVGAKFRTIALPDYSPEASQRVYEAQAYVMPYLDANLSYGSDEYSTVAVIDGELTCISPKTAEKFRNAFKDYTYVTTRATVDKGVVWLRNLDTKSLLKVCYLTGAAIDGFTESLYDYWDGTSLQVVCEAAIKDLQRVRVYDRVTAYVSKTLPTFFGPSGTILDTDANRAIAGHVKLDPLMYPEDQSWKSSSSLVHTPRDTYIRKEDCIKIYEQGRWTNEHSSVIDKTYTKLHVRDGKKCYAAKGEKVLVTVSGRKVVAEGYDIRTCYNGTVDFERNTYSTKFLGGYVYYTKGTAKPKVGDEYFEAYLAKCLSESSLNLEALLVQEIGHLRNERDIIHGQYAYRLNCCDMRIVHYKELPSAMENVEVANIVKWFELHTAEVNAQDYNLSNVQVDYSKVEPTVSPVVLKIERLAREKAIKTAKEEKAAAATTYYTVGMNGGTGTAALLAGAVQFQTWVSGTTTTSIA